MLQSERPRRRGYGVKGILMVWYSVRFPPRAGPFPWASPTTISLLQGRSSLARGMAKRTSLTCNRSTSVARTSQPRPSSPIASRSGSVLTLRPTTATPSPTAARVQLSPSVSGALQTTSASRPAFPVTLPQVQSYHRAHAAQTAPTRAVSASPHAYRSLAAPGAEALAMVTPEMTFIR